ncbi:helix-turn-helix domain-containing protein [Serratia ureilytica]
MTMIEWDEELRSRIGVMNYIHQRTRVSRSWWRKFSRPCVRVITLKMNKGKLISINRLPSEY